MQHRAPLLLLAFTSTLLAGDPIAAWNVSHGAGSEDSKVTRDGRATFRLESTGADAVVQSNPVHLEIGKSYELSAWVRTERLSVTDTDRSPIAIGAALSMASMPFDVHSESLAGTRDWTRLALRFVATRSSDRIQLSAGLGGKLHGLAWFDSATIEEASSRPDWPVRSAIRTFGTAYRYPQAGWIYLHIEGGPYERGYQHGFLMAREIERYLDRCASLLDSTSRLHAWRNGRILANAMFLRGFDDEIRQEMKGIADGAAAAGAKYDGRPVDLDDILTANTIVEIGTLRGAMPLTPSGLEGLHLMPPSYYDPKRDVPPTERCSAFAATGKATRDGKMVIGHVTWWPLTLAEQTNVMLDIRPERGRRMLIQSYPGGIESGTDYYQNDAGIVLTETTIRQSPFESSGTPVAYRARRAIQYSVNIEQVVQALGEKNNGLYTNEWLIGDGKTDEIAMYELGTHRTRLWRSSRNEWFGGTEGFYWGCNNAKDLSVRLEYAPDPAGDPEHLPYVPGLRDTAWREIYERHRGSIDEQFAFLAFRTAPLVSSRTMDAKVTTSEMLAKQMLWAAIGKPNQREWVANQWEKETFKGNDGLFPAGYKLFAATASDQLQPAVQEIEAARAAAGPPQPAPATPKPPSNKDRLWRGWILPASDNEIWLTAGSERLHRMLAGNQDYEKQVGSLRAQYRGLLTDPAPTSQFSAKSARGALLLDALRREIGDERFFALMRDFFAAHTTRTVTTAEFAAAAGSSLRPFFDRWLQQGGLPGNDSGGAYVFSQLWPRLANVILVYGTTREAGANRYAAEQLRSRFLDAFESERPLRKDFEVTDEELRTHDVVFIGRPETNSALTRIAPEVGWDWSGAAFQIANTSHASDEESVLRAGANPLARERMIVVVAGNTPLETVRLAQSAPFEAGQFAIFRRGERKDWGVQ